MVQHQDCAQDERGGIRQSLACNVRRSAVHSFKNSAIVANISARHNSQAADEACTKIADDVPIKIGEQQNVELPGIDDELHAGVIDDQFFVLDVLVSFRDRANGTQEQSVTEFHDVCLVNRVNLLAAVLARVFKRKFGYAG